MTPQLSRIDKRAAMTQRILDAAEVLFLEEGYEQTTLRRIAKDVDCNPATIYNYFDNKEAIFFQLQSRAFNHFAKEFQGFRDSDKSGYDKLCLLNRKYVNYALQNRKNYELMFIMRKPMNVAEVLDPSWKIGEKNYELLKETITECIAEDSVRIQDVESAAFMLWSTVHGMVSLIIMDRTNMIPADSLDYVMKEAYLTFEKLLKK